MLFSVLLWLQICEYSLYLYHMQQLYRFFYRHFTIWEKNLLILIILVQIMLDDIPLLKQLVQLIFYVLISLNGYLKVYFWFHSSCSSIYTCLLPFSILTLGLACFCQGQSTFNSCYAVAFYNCRQQSTALR